MSARVAILGGGIAGLASAHYLLARGLQPTLFEASDHLGGLGSTFQHDGVALDRFYHVILDSDAELCALISAMGLTDQLAWRETGMGFYLRGGLYPFNTSTDLLRFRALPPLARVRTGAGAFYMTRVKRHGLDLDDISAATWLRRLFGARVMTSIWEPLLRAKFGDAADRVPAYWVWNLLNREKNGTQEIKGYLRGGHVTLADALARHAAARGADIRMGAPVRRITADASGVTIESDGGGRERFAAAISTLPMPQLAAVAAGEVVTALPLSELRYQGVVNVLLLLRQPLERFYWTIVVDPRFAFQGVVETTHVLPPEWVGGRHLVYLMRYCDAGTAAYQEPDAALRARATAGLAALYPGFSPDAVEAAYVFRAPYVEPIWPVGYLRRRPAARVGDTRLYLSTTAQAYPRVTAWNTSVGLAAAAVDALGDDLEIAAPAKTPARSAAAASLVSGWA
jgi:protoporphyrinogen oxidase